MITSLVSTACSICFFIYMKATFPNVALPTIISLINQENGPGTFSQANLKGSIFSVGVSPPKMTLGYAKVT